VFNERLTVWYGNSTHEMAAFWSTQTGTYAPLFWTMVLLNFVIPFPLLAIKRVRSVASVVIAACGVIVGMWLERFLIVVPSLAIKTLPYAQGAYRPEWPEITIMVSAFAAMALLYVLSSKVVPLISIWELKAGEQRPQTTAAEVREGEAAEEPA
jgi:molybdopterin-containing oxidoreductase family membrane subunit